MLIKNIQNRITKFQSKYFIDILNVKLLIVILILNISCNDNGNISVINPLLVDDKKIFLSDLAEDIYYIPLDSKIPISHILNTKTTDELLFIGTYPSGLFVFDFKGNFLKSIGKVGNGPGEYKYAYNFSLDKEKELIYILDGKKVIIYSFSGEFKKQISLEKFKNNFTEIQFLNGKIYLFDFISYGFAQYDWVILSEDGNLIAEKENYIPHFKSKWSGDGNVSFYKDKIYYRNNYNDTIFEISDNEYKASALFASGDFRHPRYFTDKLGPYFNIVFFVKSKQYYFLTYNLDKYFYSSLFDLKKNQLTILNKSDKLNHNWGGPGIINDIDGGNAFVPKAGENIHHEDYLSSWEFAYEIKEYANSNTFKKFTPKNPEKKKKFKELANGLHENDNPVLMLVKLKE